MPTYEALEPIPEWRTQGRVAGNQTGVVYPAGSFLDVTFTDDSTPGVLWGLLENGKWVTLTWNNRVRAELVTIPEPPPDEPPPPLPQEDEIPVSHHITTTINIGGLVYVMDGHFVGVARRVT